MTNSSAQLKCPAELNTDETVALEVKFDPGFRTEEGDTDYMHAQCRAMS